MTDTSGSGGHGTSNSMAHTCESCGEELEYITTYKQWYCYNCQTYVDLPEPSSTGSEPEHYSEPGSKAAPELDSDSWHEEAQEQEAKSDIGSESDLEQEQTLSWEDAGIEFDDDSEDANEVKDDYVDDDSVESDESLDSDEPAQELNWDDVMDTEDSEDQLITGEEDSAGSTEPIKTPLDDKNFTTTTEQEATIAVATEIESTEESTDEFIMAGPIAGVDPETDTIENLSADEVEIEIDPDYTPTEEKIEIIDYSQDKSVSSDNSELQKKAIAKLHQAWLRVNSLKGMNPSDPRILQLGDDLKRTLEGDYDPRDGIVLADESIEEADKLEKEIKESTHRHVSDIFHFVGSKIILAKKIGFDMDELEEELDDITSLIARGEYHRARSDLDNCLQKIFDLPNTQDEIMIGLDSQSDVIQELTEPLAK